jgi:hypothetical protein
MGVHAREGTGSGCTLTSCSAQMRRGSTLVTMTDSREAAATRAATPSAAGIRCSKLFGVSGVRRKVDEEYPMLGAVRGGGHSLKRQSPLASSARTCQRDELHVVAVEHLEQDRHLLRASPEARCLAPEVVRHAVQARQGRVVGRQARMHRLEDLKRLARVPQSVYPERAQRGPRGSVPLR